MKINFTNNIRDTILNNADEKINNKTKASRQN